MDTASFEAMLQDGLISTYELTTTSTSAGATAPAWELPVPFENTETPDFPVDCLPGPVWDHVKALSISTQTPPEMAGTLSLGVLAVCLQSKFEIEVLPDWHEPLSLYTVAVSDSGEKKSPVIKKLLGPLYEYEARRREAEEVEVAQSHQEKELLESELAGAKKRAARASPEDLGKIEADVDELTRRLVEFEEKKPYRLLIDDTTPEALVDLMEAAGGAIGMSSTEGGVFDTLQGRYDNAGGLDIYLKSFSADPLRVDRIGRPGNYIKCPHLSLVLTVQPDVIRGLMNNSTFKGRGLCGRFLYAMCRSNVGRRNVTPPQIPYEVKERYAALITRLLELPDREQPEVLRLSDEASMYREAVHKQIEARLVGDLEDLRDWGNKLMGSLLRITGLFHVADGNSAETPVSLECIQRACAFAEFLISNAKAAYSCMGGDGVENDAKYILKRLADVQETTKRDLYRACRGRFKRVEEMDAGLSTLEERGYIRVEPVERDGSGRKPSPRILVNPLWNQAEK